MSMTNEKELTLEEMKELVSVANVLPALLDKIDMIVKRISELNTTFNDMRSKYSDNTKILNTYLDKVNALLEKQVDSQAVSRKLNDINTSLTNLDGQITALKLDTGVLLQAKASVAMENKKIKKTYDEEVVNIADRLLGESRGRKTRTLTMVGIKKGFGCSEEVAEKVLKLLEARKYYNPIDHILTFPKK